MCKIFFYFCTVFIYTKFIYIKKVIRGLSSLIKKVFFMKTTGEYLELLRDFKNRRAESFGIFRIGIFGSVARGEQREDSDIDICIESEVFGLFTLVHIKNELEQLFGCKVDIVRLRDKMNSMLRKRIEKEGIYV